MPKKSKRGRIERIIKNKEPKINENPKKALIIKGIKPSQIIKDLLKDLVYFYIIIIRQELKIHYLLNYKEKMNIFHLKILNHLSIYQKKMMLVCFYLVQILKKDHII